MNDKEKLEAIEKENSLTYLKLGQTDKEKIEEALRIIDGLLESSNTKLEKMRKEGKDDNNISIQFFETVNEVLGKLKETLS